MGSLRDPLENALDRELRGLERVIVRAWLAMSAIGVLLALALTFTVSRRLGSAMAAMGAVLVVVFAIFDRALRTRPLGKRSSMVVVVFESMVPWAFFGVLQATQGAAYALASWVPPLLFAALIVAWVARLEPLAPLVVGLSGAAAFLLVASSTCIRTCRRDLRTRSSTTLRCSSHARSRSRWPEASAP